MIATKATAWRSGMNAHAWKAEVLRRLQAAGAAIEQTAGGAYRVAMNDSYIVTADLRHLSENELRRLGA